MTAPLTCWVLSDGRRGIENQALGLAEAAARLRPLTIKKHIIKNQGLFAKSPAGLQFALKSSPGDYGLEAPFPEIAMGCGRQAIAPLRALKAAKGDAVFTVYIQDPKLDPAAFDLVIAPAHDALCGQNVETIIGSPNRVTPEILRSAAERFAAQTDALPAPRVAVLIGGPSKHHKLTPDMHAAHIASLESMLAQGHGIMLSTSRRTPDWAGADYRDLAKGRPDIWFYDGGNDNPYFAFLGAADAICVTEESTNMLTEACVTGKPVFRLPMDGAPGKFDSLYADLEKRCGVTRYSGALSAPAYAPLDETRAAAARLWARFDARSAAVN